MTKSESTKCADFQFKDLVKRAKEAAANAPNRDLLFDLADYIEELEAAVEWQRGGAEKAEAENAQLREALEGLLALMPDDEGPEIDAARAALQEGKGDAPRIQQR